MNETVFTSYMDSYWKCSFPMKYEPLCPSDGCLFLLLNKLEIYTSMLLSEQLFYILILPGHTWNDVMREEAQCALSHVDHHKDDTVGGGCLGVGQQGRVDCVEASGQVDHDGQAGKDDARGEDVQGEAVLISNQL